MILLAAMLGCADLPAVRVDRDNVEIRESSRVEITADWIADADDNGVIHIIGDNLTIDFTGQALRGAAADAAPDGYIGTGVRITGDNVTITGGCFHGFKVAIHATGADGLTLDGADVTDNYRQRLRSTPQAEAVEDWLWPHHNDAGEWRANYGAGVCIEESRGVTVRNVRARAVQNGIILSRVNESRLYDNDCSFLSGWGLAMWRSSDNVISRNAFDFCVRGYSHGVYNRGQDSAGLLMFEQCSGNLIAENSITHGGDGVFGFAGREALGEADPRADPAWYERRGNNRNTFLSNDLSYAAAHGLEMTFSFENVIAHNRFIGNAICGIWGGFSQSTRICHNHFERNGDMPYGDERGGINVEEGVANFILRNTFKDNACGIFLWVRPPERMPDVPWVHANRSRSSESTMAWNTFDGDAVGIQLRGPQVIWKMGNRMTGVAREGLHEMDDPGTLIIHGIAHETDCDVENQVVHGDTRPVGARTRLAGREHIIMTEWGPYDWETTLLHLTARRGDLHVYRLLGVDDANSADVATSSGIRLMPDEASGTLSVLPNEPDRVTPYWLEVKPPTGPLLVRGVLVPATWTIRCFAYEIDPREDVEAWRDEAGREGGSAEFTMDRLDLKYGHGGASQLPGAASAVRRADLPRDRFGTIATTRLKFPTGRWRVRTVSDDGIRVWLDDELVIDDWTWHAPKEHVHAFEVTEERTIALRVEHFELDGYAALALDIEPAE